MPRVASAPIIRASILIRMAQRYEAMDALTRARKYAIFAADSFFRKELLMRQRKPVNSRIPVSLWASIMRPKDERDDAYCLALARAIDRMEIKYAEILQETPDSEPLVHVVFEGGDTPEPEWGKWMAARIVTMTGRSW